MATRIPMLSPRRTWPGHVDLSRGGTSHERCARFAVPACGRALPPPAPVVLPRSHGGCVGPDPAADRGLYLGLLGRVGGEAAELFDDPDVAGGGVAGGEFPGGLLAVPQAFDGEAGGEGGVGGGEGAGGAAAELGGGRLPVDVAQDGGGAADAEPAGAVDQGPQAVGVGAVACDGRRRRAASTGRRPAAPPRQASIAAAAAPSGVRARRPRRRARSRAATLRMRSKAASGGAATAREGGRRRPR